MNDLLQLSSPILRDTIVFVSIAILSSGIIQNTLFTLQLYCGYKELRQRRPERQDGKSWWLLTSHVTVPISLIVPAYDEEKTIVDNIRSLLALHYPHFEVVVVNDGSSDRTLQVIIEAFLLSPTDRYDDDSVTHAPVRGVYGSDRYPNLLVIDKERGGKSDALNAGIGYSRSPIFCAVDADSVLESDSLLRAVQPFVDEPLETVAVGGTVRVANGCRIRSGRITQIGLPRKILPLIQNVEYFRAFLMGRLGWSHLQCLMLISGAFGIFSRQAVVEVGAYSTETVGEDMELIVRIHRYMRKSGRKYTVRLVPDPVCWTQVPSRLSDLGHQRMRWQRGAIETFFMHRAMLFNPRYGRAGIIGMGHILVIDVVGPLLEALGYFIVPLAWFIGAIDWEFFAAYLAVTVQFGIFVSVSSLALEEMSLRRLPRARDLVVLTGMAIAENFGYRQLNNLWRVGGWWQFLRKASYWNAEVSRRSEPAGARVEAPPSRAAQTPARPRHTMPVEPERRSTPRTRIMSESEN